MSAPFSQFSWAEVAITELEKGARSLTGHQAAIAALMATAHVASRGLTVAL